MSVSEPSTPAQKDETLKAALREYASAFYRQLPARRAPPSPRVPLSEEEYHTSMLEKEAERTAAEEAYQRYRPGYLERIAQHSQILAFLQGESLMALPDFRGFMQGQYAEEVDEYLAQEERRQLRMSPLPTYAQHLEDTAAWNANALRRYQEECAKWDASFKECVYLFQQAGLPHEVFMVNVNWAGTACVKTVEFFTQQGGLTQEWGKHWYPVLAREMEHARSLARAAWGKGIAK